MEKLMIADIEFNYTITNKKKKVVKDANIKQISREGSNTVSKESFRMRIAFSPDVSQNSLKKVEGKLMLELRNSPIITSCILYAAPDFVPVNLGKEVRRRLSEKIIYNKIIPYLHKKLKVRYVFYLKSLK